MLGAQDFDISIHTGEQFNDDSRHNRSLFRRTLNARCWRLYIDFSALWTTMVSFDGDHIRKVSMSAPEHTLTQVPEQI